MAATHSAADPTAGTESDPFARHHRTVGLMVGAALLLYLGYAVFHGLQGTTEALANFQWSIYVPVLALTGVNYALRAWKWHWLLRRVDVHVPWAVSWRVFVAGLGMVVTPGKAGELLKPYLISRVTQAPMARTVPVLLTERLTDGIAVALLAAVGVSTYYADQAHIVGIALALALFAIVLMSWEPAARGTLGLVAKIPGLRRIAPAASEAYATMRVCVSPVALGFTVALSLVAWWAECVGMWLIFIGLDVDTTLDLSTFLYAFATVFGAPSPGGMGMADVALVEGARVLIPPISESQAVAAAILVRVATLWAGVLLGGIMMLRVHRVLDAAPQSDEPLSAEAAAR